MPLYEYECQACEKIYEINQKLADDPVTECPECGEPVKKIMSRSSFHLKGGGWYADGYSSAKSEKEGTAKVENSTETSAAAPPCKNGGTCPCAAGS